LNGLDLGRAWVAGHAGLVGSAITRALREVGIEPIMRARSELDLRNQAAVREFVLRERPQTVFVAAALVGGIQANATSRWDFLYDNLLIGANVIGAAKDCLVPRLVFLGSSCAYPRLSPQPIKEEYLLSGPLEPTNEPYAIAKIATMKLVEAACVQYGLQWSSLMPTNLYGPGDNFDLETSHVLPAMIRKFHEAKHARAAGTNAQVTLWGSGLPRREFLYVDDLAQAAVLVARSGRAGVFNVGWGTDSTLREAAEIVARVIGYEGPVEWDARRPDGTPQKLLDSSKIRALGWSPRVVLEEGIRTTYEHFLSAPVLRARHSSGVPTPSLSPGRPRSLNLGS
jgi:GDP-L-fucose synthase